jgi:hypothetical protein
MPRPPGRGISFLLKPSVNLQATSDRPPKAKEEKVSGKRSKKRSEKK